MTSYKETSSSKFSVYFPQHRGTDQSLPMNTGRRQRLLYKVLLWTPTRQEPVMKPFYPQDWGWISLGSNVDTRLLDARAEGGGFVEPN